MQYKMLGFVQRTTYYATVQIKNPTHLYCERDQALALSLGSPER